jgi:hypothetical protein
MGHQWECPAYAECIEDLFLLYGLTGNHIFRAIGSGFDSRFIHKKPLDVSLVDQGNDT